MAQQMFGSFDPELVRQAIAAKEEESLLAKAKLSPAEVQRYVAASAGRELGNIVGGLFGVEVQDPRLRQAQLAQESYQEALTATGGDANSPQFFQAFANSAARRNLPTLAQQAATQAAALASEQMQAFQRQASGIKDIAAAQREKTIAPGQEIAQAAGALGFAIPADLRNFTTEQWQAIDKKINEQKTAQAAASAAKLNFEDPKGKVEAVATINAQLKPLTTQLTTLDQALTLRRNDKSPFSQRLFENTVAGAFGDANKAAAEITRLVNTGNLGQRVTNTLSMFLSGNIGNATKEDQLESLEAIREYVANQYNSTASPFRGILKEKADEIAPLAETRFTRSKLPPNQQYIPMSIVNQYGLTKGQRLKQGGKEFVYNGDGTVTILTKGQ